MRSPRSLALGTLAGVAMALAACSDAPIVPSHAGMHGSGVPSLGASPSAGLLKTVYSAAARFHSTTQATKAGYAEASPCVSVPGLGTMGFHWVNGALEDPVFEPTKPEAVLYLPDANGNYKLVAVEYIVIDAGQPAPTFDGHPFDVGGTPVPVPHWSQHVWLYESNPAGIFTPFNPAISCP